MQQQDASYILLSKIFSKAFQYDTVFMKLKNKQKQQHTHYISKWQGNDKHSKVQGYKMQRERV